MDGSEVREVKAASRWTRITEGKSLLSLRDKWINLGGSSGVDGRRIPVQDELYLVGKTKLSVD